MRLIGNKTRLVGDIEKFLRDRGVTGGTFLDVFTGTSAVARHFKRLGFRVIANDHLAACYTKAVAGIEVSHYPPFEALRREYGEVIASRHFAQTFTVQPRFDLSLEEASERRGGPSGDPLPLWQAVHLVNSHVEPREGLVFRNYAPGGQKGRMYFTDENAKRIDGVLEFLRDGYRDGTLTHGELHLLLSALLDAADKVANISGTYGAYLKSWQRNAVQPLRLEVPEVIESPFANEVYREDANELVRRVRTDVLYIDPPYTDRQYPANYHILEILAEHHRIQDLGAYEAALYGKTGLKPYGELKSLYCVPPSARTHGKDVHGAMTDLVLSSHARCVLASYNEEGLLTREELGAILCRFVGKRHFDFTHDMRTVPYRRFRSDSDRAAGHSRGKRKYRVLEGKGPDEVHEWLLYASRGRVARAGRGAQPRAGGTRRESLEETT